VDQHHEYLPGVILNAGSHGRARSFDARVRVGVNRLQVVEDFLGRPLQRLLSSCIADAPGIWPPASIADKSEHGISSDGIEPGVEFRLALKYEPVKYIPFAEP